MNKKNEVPDAWDDDWVTKADTAPTGSSGASEAEAKLSKSERRAKQAELNKKLWEEAEAPKNPYFVDTRNNVPLKSEFKPTVKVLSRKPAPTVIARKDPVSGLEQLRIEDDDDEDEDDSTKKAMTMEERQLKAQKEREEKQKKYEEVRERLFGSSEPSSGVASPGTVTPPSARSAGDKTRGKSRGGRENARHSSSTSDNKTRQLYDPNYNAKPDSVYVQKKEAQASGSKSSPPVEDLIVRAPRNPDGSGRGGRGFVNRGSKAG